MKNVNNISKMSPQVYIAALDIPDLSPSPVEIYGIDPGTDFTIQPWLQRPLDHPLNTGEVIVGNALSTNLSSQIFLKSHRYEVEGKLDLTQSSVDHALFLGLDDAYSLAAEGGVISGPDPSISPGDINAIMVQVEQGADPDMVNSRIRQPSSSITVIQKHFTLDPVSRDIQGLPGNPDYDPGCSHIRCFFAYRTHLRNGCQGTPTGDWAVYVHGCKKKYHLFSYHRGIADPCCHWRHRWRVCEPWRVLSAKCTGAAYQCTPGYIPYAFGSRNQPDNRYNINHSNNYWRSCVTLAGV